MYVLWHGYIPDDSKSISIPHLLHDSKQEITPARRGKKRMPAVTTPGDEVQTAGLVKASEAPRHARKLERADSVCL